jgi:hypothetical protein
MQMFMLRTIAAIVWASLFPAVTLAQFGTASNNYYPDKYNGSTFTGTVIEVKGDQITLTYTNKDKTDTFTGHFEANCSVPNVSGRGMTASDLPVGTVMTAFFNGETKKVNGQKHKENVILAISFDVWQGEKIRDDRKKIYLCSTSPHLQFRAWN